MLGGGCYYRGGDGGGCMFYGDATAVTLRVRAKGEVSYNPAPLYKAPENHNKFHVLLVRHFASSPPCQWPPLAVRYLENERNACEHAIHRTASTRPHVHFIFRVP